jgi:hypothetical protein
LRRDCAVLVAHISVLLLLEDVHGLDLVHGLAASETMTASSSLKYTIMHINASQVECSTFKMHQAENVLECVKMRHV